MPRLTAILAFALLASACQSGSVDAKPEAAALPFKITPIATFNEPWAMTFLPDGRALITEKGGTMKLWESEGPVVDVTGIPKVEDGGQGGLGDVILDPGFAKNGLIYLSYVIKGPGGYGAQVARAKLNLLGKAPSLSNVTPIWQQVPFVEGRGHFGHRLAFGPDGTLYISSGERQKFDPAQDMATNLGKILRISADKAVAVRGNPFDDGIFKASNEPVLRTQIWSLGHRNPLGIAFDHDGRLWEIEMGPQGGDEVNLIKKGANYGWPIASNGTHYDGRDIPDHKAGDGFEAPKIWWNPSISPGSLMIYSGDMFPKWRGDAFIGALGGEALIRVDLDGEKASKADQWPMGHRIREVEQGPDGAIWILEDGDKGRLLKLTPK